MPKKNVVKLLCMQVLMAGLLFGCGQSQLEWNGGLSKAIKSVDKISMEDGGALAGDFVFDVVASKEEIFAKLKEKAEIRYEEEVEAASETVNEELLGTWSLTFNYGVVIEEVLSSEYDEFHENFPMTVYLTFYDDGTFEMYAKEEELEPALQNYLESLARFFTDVTYDEFREELGEYYSEEEFEEIIESQFGMSLYDSMIEEFTDILTAEEIAEEIYVSGVYLVNGNQLHMDENIVSSLTYDIFTIEGDTLTLNPPPGAEEDPTGIEGFDYPYVFTRVAE